MVDVLLPPAFTKSGLVKSRDQAWEEGDWTATFNLWIVQDYPLPAIVYQQRSPHKSWAPGKLDVSCAGYYKAGESQRDGLREVKEEMGKDFDFDNIIFAGRKMYVGSNSKGIVGHNVVDVFMTVNNDSLESYKLQKEEVYAICSCPIDDLIRVHSQENFSFLVKGINSEGEKIEMTVDKNMFPYNWDNYHYKMALLADRLLKGEKNLIY